MQGKINRGRHTNHLAGRHSIRTNQCPPPSSPIFTVIYNHVNFSSTITNNTVQKWSKYLQRCTCNVTGVSLYFNWLFKQNSKSGLWSITHKTSVVTTTNLDGVSMQDLQCQAHTVHDSCVSTWLRYCISVNISTLTAAVSLSNVFTCTTASLHPRTNEVDSLVFLSISMISDISVDGLSRNVEGVCYGD